MDFMDYIGLAGLVVASISAWYTYKAYVQSKLAQAGLVKLELKVDESIENSVKINGNQNKFAGRDYVKNVNKIDGLEV